MKAIIKLFMAALLVFSLAGCQKSFSLPQGFVASIETVVSPDEGAGAFHVVSREIEGVSIDLSEPTYIIVRIQVIDEISYEGKVRSVRWVTSFRFQEGRSLKVLKDVNR